MKFLLILIFLFLSYPVYSKDLILFNSNNNLESINSDGTGKTIVKAGFPMELPVLSPDGEKIAFASNIKTYEGGTFQGELAVYNIKEDKIYKFPRFKVYSNSLDFTWSPDSKKIAVTDKDLYIIELPDKINHIQGYKEEKLFSPFWTNQIIILRSIDNEGIGNVVFYLLTTGGYTKIFQSSYNLGSEYSPSAATSSPTTEFIAFEVQNKNDYISDIWVAETISDTKIIIEKGFAPKWDDITDKIIFIKKPDKQTKTDEGMEICLLGPMTDYINELREKQVNYKNIKGKYETILAKSDNYSGNFFWLTDRKAIIYEKYIYEKNYSYVKTEIWFKKITGKEIKLAEGSIVGIKKTDPPPPGPYPTIPSQKTSADKGPFPYILFLISGTCITAFLIISVIIIFFMRKQKTNISHPLPAISLIISVKKDDLYKIQFDLNRLSEFINKKQFSTGDLFEFNKIKIKIISINPTSPGIINENTDTEIITE